MSFYTAKNVDLTINGTGYYVLSAAISSSASLTPVKKIGSILSNEYSSAGKVQGSLEMDYFLTGEDPIKQLTISDSPISGNFCGLYFNSGYLKSYSLEFGSNQPLAVKASFDFYEEMNGSFAAGVQSSKSDIDLLNVSDFRFNETNIINGKKMLSLSYSYSAAFQPYYSVQEAGESPAPKRVECLSKNASVDIVTNDYSIDLPSTGIYCKGEISLRNKDGVEKETYGISGIMNSQAMSIQSSEILSKKLSIAQANLGLEEAVINNITPASGPVGSHVVLSGSNLANIENVNFKGYDLSFDTPTGATGFGVTIPAGIPGSSVFGGPIEVRTKGGLGISTGTFLVT